MDDSTPRILTYADATDTGKRLLQLFRKCPIPDDEILMNLGLFLTPQTLSRILFMDFLYRQVLDVQGIAMEFGCRWGQTISLFSAFRGIYEPFNRLRKVVGFDTFEGFPRVDAKDADNAHSGMYSVTPGYLEYVTELLACQELESPSSHVKKHELVKGDASVGVHEYLERHTETIVALAYFDLDLYEPTRECLRAIKGRLTRGSVIGFDELNEPLFAGETLALKEVLGLGRYPIRRFPHNARASYIVIDTPPER